MGCSHMTLNYVEKIKVVNDINCNFNGMCEQGFTSTVRNH